MFSGQFQSIDDSATTRLLTFLFVAENKSQIVERDLLGKTTQEATNGCDLMRYSKQRDTCTRGYFFPVLWPRQLFVRSTSPHYCTRGQLPRAHWRFSTHSTRLDSIGSDTESRPPRAWRHGSQRRGANHVANHVANQLISRRQRATSTSLMRGDDRRAA